MTCRRRASCACSGTWTPCWAAWAPIEVKNQARVHLWYEEFFGFPYPPLRSTTDGIDRFLIPSTCVGVRATPAGHELYAPNGVEILYAGRLTPNPLTPHLDLFREKARSYQGRWEWLEVLEVLEVA